MSQDTSKGAYRQFSMQRNNAAHGALRGRLLQDNVASALSHLDKAESLESTNRLGPRYPAKSNH